MDESWLKYGWIDESEQMGEWVDGWRMDEKMNKWINKLWLMDGWVRIDGWMEGRMSGLLTKNDNRQDGNTNKTLAREAVLTRGPHPVWWWRTVEWW